MTGYACINETLKEQNITTNRGMIKSTFIKKGLSYCSELIILNLTDLLKILKWNKENNILLFRMSSDIFPWMTEYDILNLPNINQILNLLTKIGDYSKENKIRLTYHPGPFNVLCSNNENVVKKTIKELNQHSQIMDLIQLDKSTYNKINIHIGGIFGDKVETTKRFCSNFNLLDSGTKLRLTVENDDKKNAYSVKDLYELVYNEIGIPITFDYYHHKFNDGGLFEQEALELSLSTWKVKPVVHYSNSRKIFESDGTATAHSDFIWERMECYNKDIDVVFETKKKELSIKKYREQFNG